MSDQPACQFCCLLTHHLLADDGEVCVCVCVVVVVVVVVGGLSLD